MKNYAYLSDYYRFAILRDYGGIYCDTDVLGHSMTYLIDQNFWSVSLQLETQNVQELLSWDLKKDIFCLFWIITIIIQSFETERFQKI